MSDKTMTNKLKKCCDYVQHSVQDEATFNVRDFQSLLTSCIGGNMESSDLQIFLNAFIEVLPKVKNSSDYLQAFSLILEKCSDDLITSLLTYPPSDSKPNIVGESIPGRIKSELLLGMLMYLASNSISDTEPLLRVLIQSVEWLLSSSETQLLFRTTDLWVRLAEDDCIPMEPYVLMAVVACHWRQHQVCKDIVMHCMDMNIKKMALNCSPIDSLMRTLVFRAAMNMSWTASYKFYLMMRIFTFAESAGIMREVLDVTKNDISQGFVTSIQNKRSVSCEEDLFKYFINKLSSKEWEDIFYPTLRYLLALKSFTVADNLSKRWLPHIVKKHPFVACTMYNDLRGQDDSSIHILMLLLRLRHRTLIAINSEDLLAHLQRYYTIREESRIALFAILCDLHEPSVPHSKLELEAILKFLRWNVNSTCTALRNSMLSYFSSFVLRVFCSNAKMLRSQNMYSTNSLVQFVEEFNDWIISCLEPGSSYQRKVTALKLYDILMSYMYDEEVEYRKSNIRDVRYITTELLGVKLTTKKNRKMLLRCLTDTCEEIRAIAIKRLRYFSLDDLDDDEKSLLNSCNNMMKNRLYYVRESGVSVFMVWLRFQNDKKYIFDLYLSKLENSVIAMQDDLLNVALNDPGDSTVKVLNSLLEEKTMLDYFTDSIERLLMILQLLVKTLLESLFIDTVHDYASSFEESDIALHNHIKKSKVLNPLTTQDDGDDKFKLQPMIQLLLNYIWITLKACCKLETDLINHAQLLSSSQKIRCCDLIIQKLKLSRHKGVIEAAASALSRVIRSMMEERECFDWLDNILTELILMIENKPGASISRKSAGLSLLVQNIVAGCGKHSSESLLDKCITKLYRILDIDYEQLESQLLDEYPQSHALHFLRVIFGDARNNDDVAEYLEDFTVLCLKIMKTPIWVIRNAALQLLGVILPKLVGRKNIGRDSGVSKSFEEIFIANSYLLDVIVNMLSKYENGIVDHVYLAPILTLLSNTNVSSTTMMKSSTYIQLTTLRDSLARLLGSRILKIRYLAGKALVSLYDKVDVLSLMESLKITIESHTRVHRCFPKDENLIHGSLLCLERAMLVFPNMYDGDAIEVNFARTNLSYLTRTLLNKTILNFEYWSWKSVVDDVAGELDHIASKPYMSFGYTYWIESMCRIAFSVCGLDELEDLIAYCLESQFNDIATIFLEVFVECLSSRDVYICQKVNTNIQEYFAMVENEELKCCDNTKMDVVNCDEDKASAKIKKHRLDDGIKRCEKNEMRQKELNHKNIQSDEFEVVFTSDENTSGTREGHSSTPEKLKTREINILNNAALNGLFSKMLEDQHLTTSIFNVFVNYMNRMLLGKNSTKNEIVYVVYEVIITLYEKQAVNNANCVNACLRNHFDYLLNSKNSHALVVLSIFLSLSDEKFETRKVLKKITDLLDLKYNRDVRYDAAKAMNNISNSLDVNDFDIFWKILITLIQDEETDIRFLGSKCYLKIFTDSSFEYYSPEIAFSNLFDVKLITNHLETNEAVDLLLNILCTDDFSSLDSSEILNPFDQRIISFGEDVKALLTFAGRAILKILRARSFVNIKQTNLHYFETHIDDLIIASKEVLNNYRVMSNNLYVLSVRCYFLLKTYLEFNRYNLCPDCKVDLHEIENYCDSINDTFSIMMYQLDHE